MAELIYIYIYVSVSVCVCVCIECCVLPDSVVGQASVVRLGGSNTYVSAVRRPFAPCFMYILFWQPG